ncbi:MAG: DNA recombination protein RmuC [Crocinitomicaceae bacterium TMED114]|nr:MAG: DNA recombination protein RmuC [Crocinitomicaceae bacterium TMED114]
MDILILVFFALFCVLTVFLLLRLLRKQGNSPGLDGTDSAPLKAEIERWESRWKEDRTDAERRETDLRTALDEEKERSGSLRADVARLETELASAQQQMQALEEGREDEEKALLDRFKVLSSELLDAGTDRLKKANKAELDALLKPFKDRLDQFGKQVQDAYGEERKQQGELSEKLKQLFELNQRMTEEAHNLTEALTGNSKVQGDWGELQLETLLQNAGLEKDVHYEVQDTGRNDDGQLLRPDFLVRLPDDRLVVIDSKVSLTAYANWTAAEDKDDRTTAMKAHYGSMERHVRELGDKGYQNLYGTSPDFVLMYIPVEPALSIDFDRQNALYQMAAGKKVVPVTTSTLLATLRLISFLWKQESQRRNAEAIADRGQKLLKKFNGFLSDIQKVGDRLDQAQSSHESAMQKLFRGPGNLVSQAEKLRKLGSMETPLSADLSAVEAAVESDASPLPLPEPEADSTGEDIPDSSPNLPQS